MSIIGRMGKPIYIFADKADVRAVARWGQDRSRELLGGKGAGLFEMSRIGLPVPPGFTVTTDVCRAYYARREQKGLRGAPGRNRERIRITFRGGLNLALAVADLTRVGNHPINAKKSLICEEPKRSVAARARLRGFGAVALPQSNLNEVTLFGLVPATFVTGIRV